MLESPATNLRCEGVMWPEAWLWCMNPLRSSTVAISLPALMLAMSHARCFPASGPSGRSVSYLACQIERASSTAVSECSWAGVTGKFVRSKIEDCSSEVPAAEAKKAEGASVETLRMPRPPSLIGRVALIHYYYYYYYYYYCNCCYCYCCCCC